MSRICYVVGDINFHGGAHVATALLIKELRSIGHHIDILTNQEPDEGAKKRFGGCWIRVFEYPSHGFRWMFKRILEKYFGWYVMPLWVYDPRGIVREWLKTYDVVCVMSEGSQWRRLVSLLPDSVRKVQMIHTDYSRWCKTARGAMHDCPWYARMDQVAVVGAANAERMRLCFPSIAQKIVPFHNVIYDGGLNRKSVYYTGGRIKIVTLSRLEVGGAKCVDKMIRVAARIKASGISFNWTVYGEGPDRVHLQELIDSLDLNDVFDMPGYSTMALSELAKADISVLLSDYEGLSNGIYEAMMLGVPVFSTNVGGATEQIGDGVNGWIVENDEDKIVAKLRIVLSDCSIINAAQQALSNYRYDNNTALREHMMILGLTNDYKFCFPCGVGKERG